MQLMLPFKVKIRFVTVQRARWVRRGSGAGRSAPRHVTTSTFPAWKSRVRMAVCALPEQCGMVSGVYPPLNACVIMEAACTNPVKR